MQLYQSTDYVRFLPGGGPIITIPTEVVGVDTPPTFIANIAVMLAGQNDPCFTAVTAFGIRYIGWAIAQDVRRTERMLYVDAPSGATVHMSVVLGDATPIKSIVRRGLESLPAIYRLVMTGALKVEVSPLPHGQVIAFV